MAETGAGSSARLDLARQQRGRLLAHALGPPSRPADFDRFIAVNVRGAFFCSQAARARDGAVAGGRIINLADVGAERAWPGYIPYAISRRAWSC